MTVLTRSFTTSGRSHRYGTQAAEEPKAALAQAIQATKARIERASASKDRFPAKLKQAEVVE